MSTEKVNRVFVYGTLKKGISNHHLLSTATFVDTASTLDEFKMFDVGFPVLRDDLKPGHAVHGEVYDVDDATLKRLDALEAEGTMYLRKVVNVALHNRPMGEIEGNVSIYIGNPAYWSRNSPREYADLNVNGELEWRPA